MSDPEVDGGHGSGGEAARDAGRADRGGEQQGGPAQGDHRDQQPQLQRDEGTQGRTAERTQVSMKARKDEL